MHARTHTTTTANTTTNLNTTTTTGQIMSSPQAVYTTDVGPLNLHETIRLACTYPPGSSNQRIILKTKMGAIMNYAADLCSKGEAKPLPPFVTQEAFNAMPDKGPSISNKEETLRDYAIILAVVNYGAEEFPLGTLVRIRHGPDGGHEGETGVVTAGPGLRSSYAAAVLPDSIHAFVNVQIFTETLRRVRHHAGSRAGLLL